MEKPKVNMEARDTKMRLDRRIELYIGTQTCLVAIIDFSWFYITGATEDALEQSKRRQNSIPSFARPKPFPKPYDSASAETFEARGWKATINYPVER